MFKNNHLCHCLSTQTCRSFEVQLFQLSLVNPVVFVIIYRPPHANNNFINEFAEFLAEIVTSHDRILILGDFNIHVCCDSKPLSQDFLSLIDSFDFVQWVSGPTHVQGHTLDLILSRGLSVLNIKIGEPGLSDHMPILFSVPFDGNTEGHSPPPHWTRIFTECSGNEFCSKYVQLGAIQVTNFSICHLDADEHLSFFNTTCFNILNSIAPLKEKKSKHNSLPWHNDITRSLRQTCRRAEHKWKKRPITSFI